MNREFLELYNRELHILYENAKEFAEEFPGIAERLGGLLENNMDPMISGLLEGSAFLAARVQLKIKHEFPEFTNNLLEQLVPHYLAPTPATALLRIEPPYAEPNLKDGMAIKAGSHVEARFVERERRIACKFRLASDVMLWPFEISQAEYFSAASPLQALGLETGSDTVSGMRITLTRRTQARRDDEPTDLQSAKKPDTWFSRCRIGNLPFHIVSNESDSARIYEMLFGRLSGLHLRYLNEHGDPVIIPLPLQVLEQAGFDDVESLFLTDDRVFRGFSLLREFFVLPAKFLAFRLTGLMNYMSRINSNQVDILFGFNQSDARLAAAVRPQSFALHCVPAVNLFDMATARVPVKSNAHEYHVVADRTKLLDFEPHRITKVQAHFAGTSLKTDIYPLYSAPPTGVAEHDALFYTVRRAPRRRSQEEKRYASASGYIGSDMFITLANHGGLSDNKISEISVRALCSNRHLTEHLPVGKGGADFILEEKTNLVISCVAGPTRPTEAIATIASNSGGQSPRGTTAWRLISLLSLNHLGITGRGTTESAAALRELLSLFVSPSDGIVDRRIRGIQSVESVPIVRRVRQRNGAGVVRGLQVRITLDEKAFEGSGIFLFGAVLERFFADYAPVNNAIQTVIISSERGEVMNWPARLGERVSL